MGQFDGGRPGRRPLRLSLGESFRFRWARAVRSADDAAAAASGPRRRRTRRPSAAPAGRASSSPRDCSGLSGRAAADLLAENIRPRLAGRAVLHPCRGIVRAGCPATRRPADFRGAVRRRHRVLRRGRRGLPGLPRAARPAGEPVDRRSAVDRFLSVHIRRRRSSPSSRQSAACTGVSGWTAWSSAAHWRRLPAA